VPPDNKNSGQTLSQLVAEKANPVADVAYYGVTFGIQAKKEGVTAAYKPAAWAEIPDGLKDPEGHWFAIHSGTLGFMVNVDALKGKPVPRSWADLLKPQYKGLVGYLDPASAFVGYVGAVAVNQARGGTFDNFAPGIEYFKALQKNEPIVPKQTSYSRVAVGRDRDPARLRLQRLPREVQGQGERRVRDPGRRLGRRALRDEPHRAQPERRQRPQDVLDFVLSNEGQAIWANAYLRPVRASAMSKDAQSRFLPAADYAARSRSTT
jgi:putative spermidine/putrescine transport system substrate-binding protein